jgi:hypothetical protein
MNNKKIFLILVIVALVFSGCSEGKEAKDPEMDNNIIIKDPNTVISQNPSPVISQHPDEYYIKWAVPQLGNVNEERIAQLNTRLEADGYPFGVKLIRISYDTDKYSEEIYNCGADIVCTVTDAKDEDGNLINTPLQGITEGKYACLDEYLKDSPLFVDRVSWDRVAYNGSYYVFPSEILQVDGELTLTTRGFSFDGDLLSLSGRLSDRNTFFYGITGFDFMQCFGYVYDPLKGIIIETDGTVVNPFKEARCIEWLCLLNRWYKDGLLATSTSEPEEREKCDIKLGSSSHEEKGSFKYTWKTGLFRNYNWSTAILSTSERKKEAFQLLEVLRTNHEYGNLLIYGSSSLDEPPQDNAFTNKLVFGLDDGLKQVDDGFLHFESIEDRMQYYESNCLISPILYIDFPPEYIEVYKVVEKYLGIYGGLYTHDNFEEELKQFEKEYTDALNAMMSKMK